MQLCGSWAFFGIVFLWDSEKAMAPHSSNFAWKIPWMEEPGRLQSMGLLRVGHYRVTSLTSHSSKVMLKILQARLQQYMNWELPDVQAGFRKDRGTRDQIANICWIMEKEESSIKISTSALLTMPKPLTVWITINCGKFLKRWEYKTTWPASWETCMQVSNQQLELDIEQQTGSK